jgi:hypothetical protein
VRKGNQNAQKIAKDWLRRIKIQKIKFDSIFSTDKDPIGKENLI